MFSAAEVAHNLRLASKLRTAGFTVYCPNENATINDKSRTDITPERVYLADIAELESSQVFVCQLSEDSGTNWEAGYFDCLSRQSSRHFGVVGLATDIRFSTAPNLAKVGVDNQAWSFNAFVIGGLKLSLGVVMNEEDLVELLRRVEMRGHGRGDQLAGEAR